MRGFRQSLTLAQTRGDVFNDCDVPMQVLTTESTATPVTLARPLRMAAVSTLPPAVQGRGATSPEALGLHLLQSCVRPRLTGTFPGHGDLELAKPSARRCPWSIRGLGSKYSMAPGPWGGGREQMTLLRPLGALTPGHWALSNC